MSDSKPFSYNNTGSPISGTTQYDELVVGNIRVDYSSNYGGLKWWMGPDESDLLGYVIGNARPGGQPVPSGVTGTAQVGFWRSKFRTNESFLDLANYIGSRNSQPTFNTTTEAEIWLESNGYYTSYNLPTPTPTATQIPSTPTPTETETPTPTPTITQTNTPTPSTSPIPSSGFTATILEVGGDVVASGSGSLNINDLTFTETISAPPGNILGGINPVNALFGFGASLSADGYTGSTFSKPANFGSGNGVPPASATGTFFGVFSLGGPSIYNLMVPSGYTSGTFISASTTFTGQTFSSLGLTPGTYVYRWGTGINADSITLTVGGVAPTPTQTSVTPTPTKTSVTPTPTPTAVTGYGYNLIVLPYQPPTSGNVLFSTFSTPGLGSGTTNPNTFDVNGVLWNFVDNTSVNRTSYYSGMTGTSVTAYFTQNGNTVIYSGSSTAFATGTFSPNTFFYNPQANPNQLTLIQSASTNFVTGQTVYIRYNVN